MSPRVLFPEPETTLPATIDPGRKKEIHPSEQCASYSLPGAFYDLSITSTKTQRLSRGLAYAASRDGGFVWIICGFLCPGL